MARRVVITGVGAITPLGAGARTMFERWAAGESGIVDGEAPCSDFDARETLGPKLARRTDRFAQLALAASDEALSDAGWPSPPPPPGHATKAPPGGADRTSAEPPAGGADTTSAKTPP